MVSTVTLRSTDEDRSVNLAMNRTIIVSKRAMHDVASEMVNRSAILLVTTL